MSVDIANRARRPLRGFIGALAFVTYVWWFAAFLTCEGSVVAWLLARGRWEWISSFCLAGVLFWYLSKPREQLAASRRLLARRLFVAFVALLPVQYVLSLGHAEALARAGYIPLWLSRAYAIPTSLRHTPANRFLEWYVGLWRT